MNSSTTYNMNLDWPKLVLAELAPSDDESIRTIMDLGGSVMWNREGVVREIPNAVLRDVYDTYDFWKTEPERLRVDMPAVVGVIFWGDTVATPCTPPSPL